ncbi:alpha/beta hydrolase [Clavibacter michiganensis]|uniref:alpha/beta fold hydrolase n=1 Tax=Clavibacter michiganensis TaxID=28447 RepID=UPI0026DC087B|nr:alpha/beta hydrolase [Clavibacter michiganensis]MDO4076611.1 alpha/beta hydrolase [Clavibacter michiganensis]MDO4132253.1 alpha/beta hydrolase [Clavibacter michiganensis]MDO4138297.1 alpha/beta hydrolase [Clavibacter michiganensis]
MLTETDLWLPDGRTLHCYDTGPGDGADLVVVYHHGTPNVGPPPAPLVEAPAGRGIRWISYDRPGYGGSTRDPGRTVATTAADDAAVADALGIDRFAVLGHSSGAVLALAAAAALPGRVLGALCGAALAPIRAEGLDWFAGMHAGGERELRAAVAGREALEEELSASTFDPAMFTDGDLRALETEWAWLNEVAGRGLDAGIGGMVDDDLALVADWGVGLAAVRAPVILLHGDADRIAPVAHARWLADRVPGAELVIRPGDGHISVLHGAADALARLRGRIAAA